MGRLKTEESTMASKKELGWLHAINSGPLDCKWALLLMRSCRQYIQKPMAAGILSRLYNNFWGRSF
jgi:hypothetical protein